MFSKAENLKLEMKKSQSENWRPKKTLEKLSLISHLTGFKIYANPGLA